MKIWVGIIHNNEQQPIKKIPEREVKAATRHGTYRVRIFVVVFLSMDVRRKYSLV